MAKDVPIPSKVDKTGKNYAIELYCKDINLTKYVRRLRIIHSINARWPEILIDLNISANDIIKDNLYGDKDFRLDITVSGPSDDILETVTYYLMYMESNLSIIPEIEQVGVTHMRQTILFMMVPTYSINVLGSFVNVIIDREQPDTQITSYQQANIAEIFQNIFLNKLGFKQLEIDLSGSNLTTVTEMIIPPMSVRQCIEYLDNKFTFYQEGALFYFCDKDGKLKIWNLFNRLNKNPVLKVYQIPGSNVDDKIISEVVDSWIRDDVFYTSNPIQTNYYANARILNQGHTNCFISKPSDRLYRFYCADIDDGQVYIDHHHNLANRKKYFTNLSSFSGDLINNILGQNFKNLSRISVNLLGTILMKNIVRVGEPVEIKPRNQIYLRYQGKYILESSEIVFDRSESFNWIANCKLTMFRPNQSQTQPDVLVRST